MGDAEIWAWDAVNEKWTRVQANTDGELIIVAG